MKKVETSDHRQTGIRLAAKICDAMDAWQGSNGDQTDARQPLAVTQPRLVGRSSSAITGSGRGPQMGQEGPTHF